MGTGAEWATALSALYGAVSGGKSRFPSEAEMIRQQFQKKSLREMPSHFAQGMKDAGIHPLAAIGAGAMQGTTVPMSVSQSSDQSNLTNMLYKLSEDQGIDKEIKRESLAALKRESKNAKWDYSLLIPVTHPHSPGKTYWGFNSKYQMYGTLSQALVVAANGDEALELILREAPEEEKAKIKKLQQRLKSIPESKYKKQQDPNYGTDIAP